MGPAAIGEGAQHQHHNERCGESKRHGHRCVKSPPTMVRLESTPQQRQDPWRERVEQVRCTHVDDHLTRNEPTCPPTSLSRREGSLSETPTQGVQRTTVLRVRHRRTRSHLRGAIPLRERVPTSLRRGRAPSEERPTLEVRQCEPTVVMRSWFHSSSLFDVLDGVSEHLKTFAFPSIKRPSLHALRCGECALDEAIERKSPQGAA